MQQSIYYLKDTVIILDFTTVSVHSEIITINRNMLVLKTTVRQLRNKILSLGFPLFFEILLEL